MAASTLTYSQEMSSPLYSDSSDLEDMSELDFELQEQVLCETEFDLRESDDNQSSDGVLCDEPCVLSESVIPLHVSKKCSSPVRPLDAVPRALPAVRDVSSLVDDLVGSMKQLPGLDKISPCTTAQVSPLIKPVELPLPLPISVRRTVSKRRSAGPPMASLSQPVWRDVFRSGVVPTRPSWVCPDAWIPRHQCDEFCRDVFAKR